MIKLKLDREQVKQLCAMLNDKQHVARAKSLVKEGYFANANFHISILDLGFKLTNKYVLKLKLKHTISLSPSEACLLLQKVFRLETYQYEHDRFLHADELHLINIIKVSLDVQLKNQNFNYYGH